MTGLSWRERIRLLALGLGFPVDRRIGLCDRRGAELPPQPPAPRGLHRRNRTRGRRTSDAAIRSLNLDAEIRSAAEDLTEETDRTMRRLAHAVAGDLNGRDRANRRAK